MGAPPDHGRFRDLGLALQALALLAGARLALVMLPLPAVLRSQRRLRGAEAPADDPASELRRVRRGLGRASRFVPGARCLAQALAGQVLLSRRGVASELRLGARREGGKVEAHAWLEGADGVLLGDLPEAGYVPFQGGDPSRRT
jgi:hypothetical protein